MSADIQATTLLLVPRLVFDSAFLGWGRRPGDPTPVAIYDFASCVTAARRWFDLSPAAARDYVTTQCEGAWLGAGTPLLLHTGSPDALEEQQ